MFLLSWSVRVVFEKDGGSDEKGDGSFVCLKEKGMLLKGTGNRIFCCLKVSLVDVLTERYDIFLPKHSYGMEKVFETERSDFT